MVSAGENISDKDKKDKRAKGTRPKGTRGKGHKHKRDTKGQGDRDSCNIVAIHKQKTKTNNTEDKQTNKSQQQEEETKEHTLSPFSQKNKKNSSQLSLFLQDDWSV